MQRLPRPGARIVPEQWKLLAEPLRRYELSSGGRVRISGSVKRLQGRLVDGSYKVPLSPDDGSGRRTHSIAELVAQYFMEPPPKGYHMLQHFNDDVKSCAAHLLRWVTPEVYYYRYPTEPGSWRRLEEPLQYYSVSGDARVWSHRTKCVLKLHDPKTLGSYLRVCLTEFARGAEKATRERMHSVHRLVAMAWVEKDNDEQHPVVNHKNRNRRWNHWKNLEWATHAHNSNHSVKARKEEGTLVCGRKGMKVVQRPSDGTAELIWASAVEAARFHAASAGKSIVALQIAIGLACRTAGVSIVAGTGSSWRFETPKEVVPPKGAKQGLGYSDYWATIDGGIWSSNAGRPLTPSVSISGYGWVIIAKDADTSEGKKRPKQVYVHRLVIEAFKGPPPADKPVVDHIDGDKLNNKPGNLEYVTQAENVRRGWERRKQRIVQLTVESVAGRLGATPGDVRQFGAHFVTRDGNVWSATTEDWMYNMAPHRRRRMVCSAWNGERGADCEVVYGDPTNYEASNLRWEETSKARSANVKAGKERCKRKRDADNMPEEAIPNAKRVCKA